MFDRLRPSVRSVRRRLSVALVSTAIVAAPGITPFSLAHNVETDGEIGATFHLEPDHNPKSGEAATVWFALTRDGGETIPLSDCDCTLSIVNTQDDDKTIEAPSLTAIDVETYTDIPSAEIMFPEPGIYAVKLSGQPSATATGTFEAFELSYDVTVRPGDAQDGTTAKSPEEAKAKDDETSKASATPDKSDKTNAAAQADDTDTAGKMQRNPVVDSWAWLILSALMLGAGSVMGLIVLSRFLRGRIAKGQGRSPRRTKGDRATSTTPATTATTNTTTTTNTTATEVTPDRSPPANTNTTSTIAAEAVPAPDTAKDSDSSDSADAISSIKNWD
jgi:hypothetical protein